MASFVVQTESDIKDRISKMEEASRKNPFLKVYVQELDYEPLRHTYCFIYTPLIPAIHWFILVSALVGYFLAGLGWIFYGLLSFGIIFMFFQSKYFPMLVMKIKIKKLKYL
jgi:hypothetical protein